MNELVVIDLGRTKFGEAWDVQRRVFDLRSRGRISDTLLLTEHEHVYTLGKSGDENHILASSAELAANGVDLFQIDRGGDVTYHGPGQLVGYPVIDLSHYYRDAHRYLRDLEEVIMRTLAELGISSRRDEPYTGVWVGADKIAAIGVKVSRWITMHGFALNVNTDLSYFERIIPCGIFHKGVTSVERLLGTKVPMEDVIPLVQENFAGVFDCSVVERNSDFHEAMAGRLPVEFPCL